MKRLNVDGYIINEQDKWIYDLFEVPCLTLPMLRAFLADAKKEDIGLFINCYGGDVWTASSMYDELRSYEGTSFAKIIGLSASASSFLMLGADKVISSPMGSIMIHNAQTGAEGDYREMEHTAAMLKQTDETIRNAYEIKTGKSREDLAKYMDNETWITPQEALELGLIDEIDLKDGEKLTAAKSSMLSSSKIAACFNPMKMHEIAAKFKDTPKAEDTPAEIPPEVEAPAVLPIVPGTPNDNGEVTQPVADNQQAEQDNEHQNALRKKIHAYKEEM